MNDVKPSTLTTEEEELLLEAVMLHRKRCVEGISRHFEALLVGTNTSETVRDAVNKNFAQLHYVQKWVEEFRTAPRAAPWPAVARSSASPCGKRAFERTRRAHRAVSEAARARRERVAAESCAAGRADGARCRASERRTAEAQNAAMAIGTAIAGAFELASAMMTRCSCAGGSPRAEPDERDHEWHCNLAPSCECPRGQRNLTPETVRPGVTIARCVDCELAARDSAAAASMRRVGITTLR